MLTIRNCSPLPGKKAFPPLLISVSDSFIYPISHLVFPHNIMLPLFHIITKKSQSQNHVLLRAVLYYIMMQNLFPLRITFAFFV